MLLCTETVASQHLVHNVDVIAPPEAVNVFLHPQTSFVSTILQQRTRTGAIAKIAC